MPEGPEVASFADDLNEAIGGKEIFDFKWDCSFSHFKNLDQVPLGTIVKKVRSRGKKIIFYLDNGGFLLSSLGMEGSWYLKEKEEKSSTLVHLFFEDVILCYRDTRHFGHLEYYSTREELESRLDIGLDILFDEISFNQWEEKIKEAIKRHRKELSISEFLLEQRYISGIGNYLRAEIIYQSKVNALAPISTLSKEELERLLKFSIREARASYQGKGASLRTYKDMKGNEGKYHPVIYGKKLSPDGMEILKTKDRNGRAIWYCDF